MNFAETARLKLSLISHDDENLIYTLRSDEEIIKYTGIKKYASSNEAAEYIERIKKNMQEKSCFVWAISTKEGEKIGTGCLWNFTRDGLGAEVGYDLLKPHWGRGYAPEAALKIMEFGREFLGKEYFFAELRLDNQRSIRVLEKCGFKISHELEIDGKPWVQMKTSC